MRASRFVLLALACVPILAQAQREPAPAPPAQRVAEGESDQVLKAVDDLMWHVKLQDIADIDQVKYTSLPATHVRNPNAPGATNPLIITAYTFIPKNLDRSKKQPLIVLVHGGVHSNFGSGSAHIVRELIAQGYSIISSDYRGSTGYGRQFYEQIDYGGREMDDVYAGRDWMLENYPFLDSRRVGIMGWSHGGLITLMNISSTRSRTRWRMRAFRSATWSRGWAMRMTDTAHCTQRRITSERRSAKISRNTGAARR